jgi:arsenite methyltransferase
MSETEHANDPGGPGLEMPMSEKPRRVGPLLTEDSDELARDYERISVGRQFQSGKHLVEALKLLAGEHVLDVGCGTGLLAEHMADIVGPTGSVLGIDPLPLRIELAKAKERVNLEFRVGSAYDLGSIADATFDVVCLNAVFHWLPEKTGPLRDFARVLKRGGRIGIGGGAKEQPSQLRDLMAQVLSRPPFDAYPRPAGGVAHRVDQDELRTLLEAAGFELTWIEIHDTTFMHASPEAAVRFSQASSFGNLLGHLPADQRRAARDAIVRALASIATPDGTIIQPGRRMLAVAVRR